MAITKRKSQIEQDITALELVEPIQAIANVAHVQDVPPNGGYGWVCTGKWTARVAKRPSYMDQAVAS